MPISYKIEDGIVYVTLTGKIEVQEQMQTARGLSNSALPSPLKILRDTRKQVGTIGGSLQSLKKIIGFAASTIPPGTRLAIVTSNSLIFGSSRIAQAHLDEVTNIMVFRDFDEAREWLLADNSEIPPRKPPARLHRHTSAKKEFEAS